MNRVRYDANRLEKFLKKKIISTLPELKGILGVTVNKTVTRKLNALSYRTSYSHGGIYYTLDKLTQFNEMGLWCYRSVCFSRYGRLISTLRNFVTTAQVGCSTRELKAYLQVSVKASLLKLINTGDIVRKKVSGVYIYCALNASIRKQQLLARKVMGSEEELLTDDVKAAIILFISVLDEKQRRLYAGLESLKLGGGGDKRIADLVGLHDNTVARGRRELLNSDIEQKRTRKVGAGRYRVEKKRRK